MVGPSLNWLRFSASPGFGQRKFTVPVVKSAMASRPTPAPWSCTENAVGPAAFDSLLPPTGSWGWGDPALLARLDTPGLAKSFRLWCSARGDVRRLADAAKAVVETTAQGLRKTGFAKVPTFAIAWWEGQHLDAVALVGFAGNLELCPEEILQRETAEEWPRLKHFRAAASIKDGAAECVRALLRHGWESPDKSAALFDLGHRMGAPSFLVSQPEEVLAAVRAWQLETAWEALSPIVPALRHRM